MHSSTLIFVVRSRVQSSINSRSGVLLVQVDRERCAVAKQSGQDAERRLGVGRVMDHLVGGDEIELLLVNGGLRRSACT